MRKETKKKENIYRRERTRAAYVLLLYFSLYFLFVVLRGSRRPFEGAYVPHEKSVPTPNSGSWYPKPRRGGGQGRAVVLTGSWCPFSFVPRTRPGSPEPGSLASSAVMPKAEPEKGQGNQP